MENSVLKEKSVKCSRSIKILALACLVLSLVSLGVSCFEFVVHVNKLQIQSLILVHLNQFMEIGHIIGQQLAVHCV